MIINKKSNITIITLWVLSIASMLGLYIFSYINLNLQYFADIYWYYQSFYFAKAWTEIWLVISNNTQIWFEDELFIENEINKNFSCNIWISEKSDICGFDLKISSRNYNMIWSDPFLDNSDYCKSFDKWQNNYISLEEWQSFVLPLLYDNRELKDLKINDELENIWSPILDNFEKNPNIKFYENYNIWFITKNNSSDIVLSFYPLTDSFDYINDRDVFTKLYTGVGDDDEIINSFLYDNTPLYYQKKEDWTEDLTQIIENKKNKFGKFPSFLVIKNPKNCPSQSLNPDDIISNYNMFDFWRSNISAKLEEIKNQYKIWNNNPTICQKKNESDTTWLVWQNCVCPNWLNYDYISNICTKNDVCNLDNNQPESDNLEDQIDDFGNEQEKQQKKIEFCINIRENIKNTWISNKNNKIVSNGFFWPNHKYKSSMWAIKIVDIPSWLFETTIEWDY